MLASAGLVIQHFLELQTQPLGFGAHGLLTVEVTPSPVAYPGGPRRSELVRRIVAELRDDVTACPGQQVHVVLHLHGFDVAGGCRLSFDWQRR
jgi:hypothetical protein